MYIDIHTQTDLYTHTHTHTCTYTHAHIRNTWAAERRNYCLSGNYGRHITFAWLIRTVSRCGIPLSCRESDINIAWVISPLFITRLRPLWVRGEPRRRSHAAAAENPTPAGRGCRPRLALARRVGGGRCRRCLSVCLSIYSIIYSFFQ